MPEWPDDLLSGADEPRPLPPALRQRLEQRLLSGIESPRPLDPELSARLAEEMSDPVAVLLTDVDGPRELPPALRQRLTAQLTQPRGRRVRWLVAVAATVIALAGAGVAIQRLATSSSSTRSVAAASTTTLPSRVASVSSGNSGAVEAAPNAGGAAAVATPGQVPMAASSAAAPAPPVNPAFGSSAGGNSVTLTGTGFDGVTRVRFGSTSAKTFQVLSDSEIRVVVPAHSPGRVDVSVVTPSGTRVIGSYDYTA